MATASARALLLFQSQLVALLSGAAALPAQDGLHTYTGRTMGSSFELRWWGADDAAVRAAVDDELAVTDRTFSQWRPDSELMAFDRLRSTEPFAASERLRAAVALALQVAAATDGAFDATVKPLCDLYRRMKRDPAAVPTAAELAAARARIGWRRVRVVGETIVKDREDVELDLDGLVAGMTADRLGARLQALGVRGFLLDLTGELLAHGRKPDGSPWSVGIADPVPAAAGRERARVLVPLLDAALCTSGAYHNFVARDGAVTSHVFDPRTGDNPRNGVVSASVFARSCGLADALGTALLVLGPDGAAAALARAGDGDAGAWFVVAGDDGELRDRTVGWPELFALDGRALALPEVAPGRRQELERALAAAAAANAAAPGDVEAVSRHALRLADLQRFREACAVLDAGLAAHPREPHLLRQRGQLRIVQRRFADAERDLALADELVRNSDERVGQGSSLRFAVADALGRARFLLGDFAGAEAAWGEARVAENSDDDYVAVRQWLWCARMRGGNRRQDVILGFEPLNPDPKPAYDRSDYELWRLDRGRRTFDEIEAAAGRDPVIAFGLAQRELVRGAVESARARLQRLAASPAVASFSVIAAEAELQRLPQ
jgi:thiamine biosynthesis lipoprotein